MTVDNFGGACEARRSPAGDRGADRPGGPRLERLALPAREGGRGARLRGAPEGASADAARRRAARPAPAGRRRCHARLRPSLPAPGAEWPVASRGGDRHGRGQGRDESRPAAGRAARAGGCRRPRPDRPRGSPAGRRGRHAEPADPRRDRGGSRRRQPPAHPGSRSAPRPIRQPAARHHPADPAVLAGRPAEPGRGGEAPPGGRRAVDAGAPHRPAGRSADRSRGHGALTGSNSPGRPAGRPIARTSPRFGAGSSRFPAACGTTCEASRRSAPTPSWLGSWSSKSSCSAWAATPTSRCARRGSAMGSSGARRSGAGPGVALRTSPPDAGVIR